jgi:UDP-3-O-[3-hydroxymyristoyl] glucosamine N-acyltransferase
VQVTVQQLAALVEGQVHGDGSLVLTAARALHEAGPGQITFLDHERHGRHLKASHASAAVVGANLIAKLPDFTPDAGMTFIAVKDPLLAFITVVEHLHGRPTPPLHGIDPQASVDPAAVVGPEPSIHAFACVAAGAVVGARCRIHSGAVVGRDCRLGDDVTLYPNVVLYDGTVLGDRVIIHANAVLGADGFGYRLQNARHVKVPQLGSVDIGDDVEIGACTTIDRGTFQATRVGAGTKIDNLVQIGHNCRIGKHNLLVSQVGVAGSCTTGDYVVMAGQVGVADHVHIGDKAQIGAKAGVPSDLAASTRYLGIPAKPENEARRIMLSLERLPGLVRDMRALKQHLGIPEN